MFLRLHKNGMSKLSMLTSMLRACCSAQQRQLQTTASLQKKSRDEFRIRTKMDEGIQSVQVSSDQRILATCELPDVNTAEREFNGIPYKDIPILNIKISKNNTKLFAYEPDNRTYILHRSCGMDGFKNCRKGTNVAAHTTSLNMGKKLQLKGIKTVKLSIKGLGPGRLASIQGLVQSGINIVSISEHTNFNKYPPRPPLPRRI